MNTESSAVMSNWAPLKREAAQLEAYINQRLVGGPPPPGSGGAGGGATAPDRRAHV